MFDELAFQLCQGINYNIALAYVHRFCRKWCQPSIGSVEEDLEWRVGDHQIFELPSPRTTLECINLVNNGINYQPQLVSRISSINSIIPYSLFAKCRHLPALRPRVAIGTTHVHHVTVHHLAEWQGDLNLRILEKVRKNKEKKNNFQIMLWFMFVHINLFVFRGEILRKSKNFQISLEGFEVEIEFRNSENIVCFSAPGSTTPPSYPRNPEVVKWIWVALKDVSKWRGCQKAWVSWTILSRALMETFDKMGVSKNMHAANSKNNDRIIMEECPKKDLRTNL